MDFQIEEVLLKEVSSLQKQYDFISQFSGENFNVFKLLQLESNEVRTHSAILAEFLNPKGSHGQKDLFLKLFTENNKVEDFETSSAIAEVERYTGLINEDCTKGGRIDILITDKHGKRIIIENKIYAGDQKNQLLRYYNFDPSAHIFYLNLYGEAPSDWSTANELDNTKFQVISYVDDILNWLEKCKKEAVSLPIIRETISQYIHLIKYLTGTSINKAMERDLANKIAKSKEYISSAFTISNTIGLVKQTLMTKFVVQLGELASELHLIGDNEDFGVAKASYYWFYFPGVNTREAAIGFCFEDGLQYFSVGVDISNKIDRKSEEIINLRSEVSHRLTLAIGNDDDKTKACLYLNNLKAPLGNWSTSDNWEKIATGELKSEIKEILEKVIQALQGIEF